MRTIAIVAAIAAVILVILGLILDALGWLIAIGLVLLVAALIVGWLSMRRSGPPARSSRSR